MDSANIIEQDTPLPDATGFGTSTTDEFMASFPERMDMKLFRFALPAKASEAGRKVSTMLLWRAFGSSGATGLKSKKESRRAKPTKLLGRALRGCAERSVPDDPAGGFGSIEKTDKSLPSLPCASCRAVGRIISTTYSPPCQDQASPRRNSSLSSFFFLPLLPPPFRLGRRVERRRRA